MVTVRLKGVHVVRVRGKEYHYAWRGGPRLTGAPGSPQYLASYHEANQKRVTPSRGTLAGLLTAYKASPDYTRLGDHTTRAYVRHLDAIQARWGTVPLAALNDPKIRRAFNDWRDSMAATPRTADMAVGVLKTVLAWGLDRAILTANHADGMKRLHRVNKADAIWTDDDFAALKLHASAEVWAAVQLAAHTGLRQSDLIRLAWNHEADGAFGFLTAKRGRFVTIPITADCRKVLAIIPKRGPVILTTRRGKRPWTADGLRSSFGKACKDAGVKRTFHDLRRTAATRLVSAGLDSGQVASIMGWAEEDVEAMKRKYVSRGAVVKAALAKLEKGG